MNVYREGNVAIANAPGAGVADDKAVYAYMPALIKYYLDQEPLLGQVPTYVGLRKDDFAYMRENLATLVVKTTGDSGGYNMLMGPFATRKEIDAYAGQLKKAPGNYIAQPLVELSSHPTWVDGKFEPRRIDLRPFILYGDDDSRAARAGSRAWRCVPGSYVVNSSQGGGSKDTWVLAPRGALMLSRVADALYWMGRYLERAENITRLLLVTEDFSSETQGLAEQVAQSAWKDLLAIFPSSHWRPPRPPSRRLRCPTCRPSTGRGQPLLGALFAAAGARERPFGARGPDRRGVPGAERDVPGPRGSRATGLSICRRSATR